METSPSLNLTSSTEAGDASDPLFNLAARGYQTGNERGLNENLTDYLADLAALSTLAQHDEDATAIIARAVALARDALKADYCALYEVASGTHRMMMRQGGGWRFALTGEFDLEDIVGADTFTEPPYMADGLAPDVTSGLISFMHSHHVSAGINARIESRRGLRGLFAVYSTQGRRFLPAELDFLQIIANVIGMALTTESDASERRQAASLEAARLKSAFLANTTHEIRSPLNVIMGYTELVAENLSEAGDRSQLRYLEAVKSAGQRLLSTVEKILDYARLDSGDFVFHPEPIDVASTLSAIIEEHRASVEAKGLTLMSGIDGNDNTVLFDRRCLANVIANPLLNAIKFTEAGYVSVRLFRTAAGQLKLEISDSGIGIDSAYLARAFEPFSQEDWGTARRFEGVGLGLALTRRCAALNGASVEVQSRKGGGTTVTIKFGDAPVSVAVSSD
jgi:signal transduction histidine kinase